jgi:hypothetical protein
MASDLVINIASQFTGRKAFSDAEKATKKLTGSVKSLGRQLGISLSVAAVLAYGRASVRAASADMQAQKLLANSLKNVGLAYASVDVEAFIQKMQKQTGILDDSLRPAFTKLAGVTGSVAKTQKIMASAFDVSSGTGIDYATTVDILSAAYVGNLKGLKQLDLGFTTAELSAMSFDEIMAVINKRFAGAGAAALDTYAGKLDLLKASASIATKTIGVSLIGALESLGGNNGMAQVGTDIENAAKSLSNFIDSVIYLKEQMATIPGAGIVKSVLGVVTNILGRFSPQRAAELLKEIKGAQPFSTPMSITSQDTSRADAKAKTKAELDAIARNKALAALAKAQAVAAAATLKAKRDQALLDKASLALNKGQDVFNLDAIEIQAALLAKQDEINKLGATASDQQKLQIANDLVRLTVKQDMLNLEAAIANKDVEGATALATKLNTDLAILGVLSSQTVKLVNIQAIIDSFTPKDLINLKNLQDALDLLAKIKIPILTVPTTSAIVTTATGGGFTSTGDKGGAGSTNNDQTPGTTVYPNTEYPNYGMQSTDGSSTFLARNPANIGNGADALRDAMLYALEQIAASKALANGQSSTAGSGQGAGAGEGQIPAGVTVTIVDKTSGLIEVVQDAVQQNARYGNSLNYAGAL